MKEKENGFLEQESNELLETISSRTNEEQEKAPSSAAPQPKLLTEEEKTEKVEEKNTETAAEKKPEEKEAEKKEEYVKAEHPAETGKEAQEKGTEEQKAQHKKTVPLEALHEERGKNRTLREENKRLLAVLEENNQKLQALLEGKIDQKPEETATDDDIVFKKDLKALMLENQSLKKEVEGIKNKVTSEERKKEYEEKENSFKTIERKITSEKIPLIPSWKQAVHDEITNMILSDPEYDGSQESYAEVYKAKIIPIDNVEGWTKIYKERVYPKVQQAFNIQKAEEISADKKTLKEKSNLVSSTGTVKMEKKEDDDYSPEKAISDLRNYIVT